MAASQDEGIYRGKTASFFILRCTKKVADWATAAVCLTFASVFPRVMQANVKSQTALESKVY